ncbi:helix-turn-helix transcriptional regulator [Streptomyces hainanensis]|uniref:AraC family transcriptional regulator n=1 Tax=Streptomyces hainanensis TaxID=402648 RepID=A0A4R4T467_9ACTN|nr:AraC family transcriptional regulator [Streptomyces hainanensis]TDC69169.1 AraC family transcriptional regulator [Streptomyces hainanensis]
MAQLSTGLGDLSRLQTLVDSSDLEETREIISHAYSPYQLDCLGDPREFAAWYAEDGFPGVTISGLRYGSAHLDAETLIKPQALETYLLVCQVTHGRVMVSRPGREEHVVGPGETYVLDPYRPFQVRWSPGAQMTTLRLDRDVVERAAADAFGVDGAVRARFALGGAVSPDAARTWGTISGAVHREVLGEGIARTNPLVATHLTQTSAALLVQTHRLITPVLDAGHTGLVAHSAVRRAMALVEERPDEPHTLADLASAARVSPRALQEAFRQHLDTTPLGYLREVRLRRAHQDLLTAGEDGSATVTDVAYRWGFSNLGRFAAYYRDRYGHPPSKTLSG